MRPCMQGFDWQTVVELSSRAMLNLNCNILGPRLLASRSFLDLKSPDTRFQLACAELKYTVLLLPLAFYVLSLRSHVWCGGCPFRFSAGDLPQRRFQGGWPKAGSAQHPRLSSAPGVMQAAPYTHATAPHAVASRTKYREPMDDENIALANNIMYDKRVVRGNTYAAQILPATAQAEQLEMERKSQMQTRAKRTKPPPKPDTPPAADGRKHIDVQTEQYLEELTDRPIEADIETQTDAFMDQLPAPIFIPMKTGVDVETQIYDGDLFDFDAEVDPILEVRVTPPPPAARKRRGAPLVGGGTGGETPFAVAHPICARATLAGACGQDTGAEYDGGDGGGGARQHACPSGALRADPQRRARRDAAAGGGGEEAIRGEGASGRAGAAAPLPSLPRRRLSRTRSLPPPRPSLSSLTLRSRGGRFGRRRAPLPHE